VVIDAVRCAKLALDRGLSGQLLSPSSYLMKSPAGQYTDEIVCLKTGDLFAGK
jgi:myo-inositol-1-phosphate synthase